MASQFGYVRSRIPSIVVRKKASAPPAVPSSVFPLPAVLPPPPTRGSPFSPFDMADASLARALTDDKLDHAVHALLLLLGDPLRDTQLRRFATLQRAVASVGVRLQQQRTVSLHAGLASPESETPLSYAQLQMVTLQTLAPQSTAYNIVRAVRMGEATPLDETALYATCDVLLSLHAILRTVYETNAYGDITQRVVSLESLKEKERMVTVLEVEPTVWHSEDALSQYIRRVTTTPFDLAKEAPVRFYAIRHPELRTQWVLVVVVHHIATDPESSSVFWTDFRRYYSKYLRESVDAETLQHELWGLEQEAQTRISYRDFAQWQRHRLDCGLLASSLQYWTHQLSFDETPHLDLPYDRSPPPLASPGQGDRPGSTITFQSTPQLQQAFTGICVSQGASLFIGLLSVFHMLVSRLAHAEDVVIGAPTSGRSHEALRGLMGYFVSTLPFRIRAQPSLDFVGFLHAVKNIVVDGFSHMEIPLQKMLEHIQLDRSTNQNALFQVMFAWENESTLEAEEKKGGIEMTEVVLPHATAKFDLMLSMRYAKNSVNETVLEGTLEYPTDVFDHATVERFTQYFLELMTHITQSPEGTKLSEIQMIPKVEREMMLRDWGSPLVVTPLSSIKTGCFLDECVFAQVQQTPTNIALQFEGTAWTYQELWHSSSLLAAALRATTGKPQGPAGTCIGLFLDRGLENIAAIFGVLQCQAVFISLDPEFPMDRIRYMLADSQAEIVITQRHLVATLEQLLETSSQRPTDLRILVCEDAFEADMSTAPLQRIKKASSSDPANTIAYILYTSGSTGRPKGVMVTHANLLTTLQWTVREYAITPNDLFLQSTSSTLDGSLTQLFSPLLAGASVLITKKNGLHDLGYIASLFTTYGITFCVFVPSYFAMLIDYMSAFPPSVKYVVLAGEAFPTALATKFYTKYAQLCDVSQIRLSSTCLVNEYGPTEASVTSTFFRIPCALALSGQDRLQSVPIGRAVDDHFLLVLDNHKRLVPVNVAGELYIGGRGIAKGYWNRPELTAANFHHKELAWLDENGEIGAACDAPIRWYKTGDRVKWLGSGELLFLGRTDAQIKLRGMRIELHEVRNVLLQSMRVKDAEVLVVRERLVAFVVFGLSGRETDRAMTRLREELRRQLPVHMVPHEIVIVDEWPRTPNGKLDVRALAQYKPLKRATNNNHHDENGHQQGDEPGGGNTAVVVGILKQAWREVLHLDDECLLTRASFFELGGNSLSAIRVISLVKPHGISLKLEAFFRCKTLLEMAATCASTLMIDSSLQQKDTVIPLNWKPWVDGNPVSKVTMPLFLIHCADGTVWKLMELAQRLSYPVFGVQVTHCGSVTSVEDLAATYWDEIQRVQRSGPYRIGGFSFGCRIAHALAVLGHEEGAVFEPLTLLDGVPFYYGNRHPKSIERKGLLKGEDSMDAETNVTGYVSRALGYTPSHQQPQDGANRADHTRDPERELFDQLVANVSTHCSLDNLYRPCTSGRKCEELISAKLFKTAHWHIDVEAYRARGIAIEIVPIEGEHLTMLRMPHVERVAQAVQTALES